MDAHTLRERERDVTTARQTNKNTQKPREEWGKRGSRKVYLVLFLLCHVINYSRLFAVYLRVMSIPFLHFLDSA